MFSLIRNLIIETNILDERNINDTQYANQMSADGTNEKKGWTINKEKYKRGYRGHKHNNTQRLGRARKPSEIFRDTPSELKLIISMCK